MAKFVRVTTLHFGGEEEMFLNIDDISRVAIGLNMIILKAPFGKNSNCISVTTETIGRLMSILDVVGINHDRD